MFPRRGPANLISHDLVGAWVRLTHSQYRCTFSRRTSLCTAARSRAVYEARLNTNTGSMIYVVWLEVLLRHCSMDEFSDPFCSVFCSGQRQFFTRPPTRYHGDSRCWRLPPLIVSLTVRERCHRADSWSADFFADTEQHRVHHLCGIRYMAIPLNVLELVIMLASLKFLSSWKPSTSVRRSALKIVCTSPRKSGNTLNNTSCSSNSAPPLFGCWRSGRHWCV